MSSLDILYFPLALRFSISCRNWPYSDNIWGLLHLFSKTGNQKLTFMTSGRNGRVIAMRIDFLLIQWLKIQECFACYIFVTLKVITWSDDICSGSPQSLDLLKHWLMTLRCDEYIKTICCGIRKTTEVIKKTNLWLT